MVQRGGRGKHKLEAVASFDPLENNAAMFKRVRGEYLRKGESLGNFGFGFKVHLKWLDDFLA